MYNTHLPFSLAIQISFCTIITHCRCAPFACTFLFMPYKILECWDVHVLAVALFYSTRLFKLLFFIVLRLFIRLPTTTLLVLLEACGLSPGVVFQQVAIAHLKYILPYVDKAKNIFECLGSLSGWMRHIRALSVRNKSLLAQNNGFCSGQTP